MGNVRESGESVALAGDGARVVRLEPGYHGYQRLGPAASGGRAAAAMETQAVQHLAQPARSSLVENLERIRTLTLAMGEMVDQAIANATDGLIQRDIAISNEVIRGDAAVNALQAEARQLCFHTILTQAPVARDLRELLGFQHMAAELERMADHCVNIARVARDLADLPPLGEYVDIPKLSREVAKQVRDVLGALTSHDIDEARAIAAGAHPLNHLGQMLADELFQTMSDEQGHVYQGTKLIAVCQNFERIADRVTNLAEDLVFLESGEIEDLG